MRPNSLALKWLLYCFIQGNRNCRTCRWGRCCNICLLRSRKVTMSNRRIRGTTDVTQHTCHTSNGGEKSISGSPDTEQTPGVSSGSTAVLPGLSNSSPLKPRGPWRWEYGQLMKLKCLPAKIFKALSFLTLTQGTSFWWGPFLFTCRFLKSPTSSLQKGW